ncbi:hypothetical protein GEMRC1_011893 [Eukaryota sp. GEM-RC1]
MPSLKSIVEFLPAKRQTMLFSATLDHKVSQLAMLSLNNPVSVDIAKRKESITPRGLHQKYMIVPHQSKINVLYSFIRTHLKDKIIVFLSCCKQVQFYYKLFCHLRPGVSLLSLYGRQKQKKRQQSQCVLFCTDIAARGLDFPDVSWVLQVDCPDDVTSYVHRVGRTARFRRGGKGILMVTKEELGFIDKLKSSKVQVDEIKPNQSKLVDLTPALQAMLSPFVAFVRSVHLQPDKEVFDPRGINLIELASSYGLNKAPRIRFIAKKNQDQNWKQDNDSLSRVAQSDSESESDDELFTTKKAVDEVDEVEEVVPIRKKIIFGDAEDLLVDNVDFTSADSEKYYSEVKARIKSSDDQDKEIRRQRREQPKEESDDEAPELISRGRSKGGDSSMKRSR